MKRENAAEKRREDLAMTHFLGRILVGEIETLKARGEKDLKLTLSGGGVHQRRSGDVEKGAMRKGLIGEMKIDPGVWEMMKRESPLLDQMMIGCLGAAWMTTEALDVVLMKIASLVVEQMMTVLLGVMQMMTGLPDELVMMTGEVGVMQMMIDHLDEDWMTTEEAGEQLMRTEDQDVEWMRTGGPGEEVLMMSDHPGAMLMMIGVPGGAWMMTGVPGEGWMMTEDLGGMLTMIEFPDVVQMMTGGLGETWMTIGFPDVMKRIGFPDEVKTPDLVPGGHLSSQADGERKKRPEKRVGVHLENQGHQKNVNGIETKKGIETIKIVRRMRKTLKERGTEREMVGIVRIASEDPGMKVAGEEDQLRNLRAGEIQVAEMTEIGMIVVVREMIVVI